MAQRFGEQLVGGGEVFFAVAEQHAGPVCERNAGRFGHQGRLAQTSLTRDQEELAVPTGRHPFEGIGDRRHLGFAADHADRRVDGQARWERDGVCGAIVTEGLPDHLHRLDRVGQAFEGQLPERPAFVAIATTGHPSEDVRRKDLSALAPRTEAGGLDHRVSEVVVVFAADFAPAEPDPQTHRILTTSIVLFDTLLHGHGAAQCRRGRAEDDHQPVAQVLYLGAARFGDGLAEKREVTPADLVGGLGRQTLGQFGRPHDVREQDGHGLGAHESPSGACTLLP